MKVLLFGATGQLGSDIRRTRPDNVEVMSVTRQDADVTDSSGVERKIKEDKPDMVINSTAYVRVDDAEIHPLEAFSVNAVAVRDMAVACGEMGIPLMHMSTDYVFDGRRMSRPYTEEDIPNPLNTYGLSKFAGEIYLKNTIENHYIIRVAGLYGRAGASGKGGNFVYTVISKASRRESMRIVNDIYVSPTYTLDAARNIWEIIIGKRPYGTYHVTNGGCCSWHEFAMKILQLSGIKAEITPVSAADLKSRAPRPRWSALKSVKGSAMRHWEEALREFLLEAEVSP